MHFGSGLELWQCTQPQKVPFLRSASAPRRYGAALLDSFTCAFSRADMHKPDLSDAAVCPEEQRRLHNPYLFADAVCPVKQTCRHNS